MAIFCGLLVIRLKKNDKVVDGKKNTDGLDSEEKDGTKTDEISK